MFTPEVYKFKESVVETNEGCWVGGVELLGMKPSLQGQGY